MVFGYGSLASPTSAALSLGRPVEFAAVVRLAGWRRRWTVYRDNVASEKTFALTDGSVPPHVVGLNIERDAQCEGANGVLIEITEAEAERLDLREMRYDRIDVTADVGCGGHGASDRVHRQGSAPCPAAATGGDRHRRIRAHRGGGVHGAGPGRARGLSGDE